MFTIYKIQIVIAIPWVKILCFFAHSTLLPSYFLTEKTTDLQDP